MARNENIPVKFKKQHEMRQEIFLMILAEAISGTPMPEIASYRGS